MPDHYHQLVKSLAAKGVKTLHNHLWLSSLRKQEYKLILKQWVYVLHFYGTDGWLMADWQKKCLERLCRKMVSSPSEKVHFQSYTHGRERKCTRAKHHGRLKQKWSSFHDYLNIAYWYPRITPVRQVSLPWYPRMPPNVQGLSISKTPSLTKE